jgi:hypothetical protein
MSLYLVGLIFVTGVAVVAAAVAFVVHRLGAGEGRTEHNDAIGQVFTIVGGLHAVLMAFVLISLFDAAGTASADSYREANTLVAIDWAGDSLPEPARGQIHALSQAYLSTVIDQEWPRMRAGQDLDDTGWAQLEELRLTIEHADAAGEWQQDRKQQAANRLWEVYQARQDRIAASGGGVGLVLWFALVVGSVMSLALPNLLGGTRLATHIVVMAVLAATIALLLFAIYQMQNPFSGGASIEPEAFQSARELLG